MYYATNASAAPYTYGHITWQPSQTVLIAAGAADALRQIRAPIVLRPAIEPNPWIRQPCGCR